MRAAFLAATTAVLSLGCEDPFFRLYDGGVTVDATPIDGGIGCSAFAFHQTPYASDAGAAAVVPYSADEALFATEQAGVPFYLVGKQDTLEAAPIDAGGFVPISAFRRDTDVWFGGNDGTLMRLSLDTNRLAFVATASKGDGLRFLSGADAGDFELFALSDHDVLYRFDGAKFERLWAGTSTAMTYRSNGGVAWVGPNEAYVVPLNSICNHTEWCVVHSKNGAIDEEMYPSHGPANAFDYATTVAFIRGLGPIVGTVTGWSLSRGPSGWIDFTYLAMYTEAPDIRAIIPFGPGFMAFSERHALQWTPDQSDCLEANLFYEDTSQRKIVQVNKAAAVNGAIVAVADAFADGAGFVVVLQEVTGP
jgi:hypothetical protein